jgi:hypothetical protein
MGEGFQPSPVDVSAELITQKPRKRLLGNGFFKRMVFYPSEQAIRPVASAVRRD